MGERREGLVWLTAHSEQDELKYSMRSVVTALEGHIRTCHLVLYDFAFNLTRDLDILPQSTVDGLEGTMRHHRAARSTAESFRDENGTESGVSEGLAQRLSSHWRVVQTPTWLDFSKLDSASPDRPAGNESSFDSDEDEDKPARPNFRYAAHSEIFHLPTKEGADIAHIGEAEWKEAEWRKKALPTYNSMAIESRLGWLPGLGDVSLALNDDFFMLRPHSVSDFHSLLYGNVFRFDWSVSTWRTTSCHINVSVAPTWLVAVTDPSFPAVLSPSPPHTGRHQVWRRSRDWGSQPRQLPAVAALLAQAAAVLCAHAEGYHSQPASRG